MKKRYILMIAICTMLSLFVSCNGSVDEMLFGGSFEVTFDSNGGTAVQAQTVKKDDKVIKPTDPEKDCYKFVNWTTDKDGTEEYDFDLAVNADITLYAQWRDYIVGDIGPAGGIIFYINPSYEKGSTDSAKSWKYLEAGKADLSGKYKWGPQGTDCETETKIGAGAANTKKLYDKGSSYQAAYAVYEKDLYNNGYTDWFLPSNEELKLMYNNLHKHDPAWGDFSTSATPYLSSSEDDSNSDTGNKWVYLLYFSSGNNSTGSRDGQWLVRPARTF